MDITQLSTALSMEKVATQVGTAVLGMTLDTIEQSGEGLTKIMEQSVNPNLGGNIDIRL